METKPIELEWHKIMNLAELISIEKEIRGKSAIYVWGWYDTEANFVPYYVGKTCNLSQRLWEHLVNLRGGAYTIYSEEYAYSKDFHPLRTIDGDRLLYVPSTIDNWQSNFHSDKVQESLERLFKNLRFSWCLTDKSLNCELERFIYHKLNLAKKVGASVRGDCKLEISPIFSGEEVLVKLCQQSG